MRPSHVCVTALLISCAIARGQTCGAPTGQPLSFSPTNLGVQAIRPLQTALTPSGGTPPYDFSYSPGAVPIPGFQILNAPDLPSYFQTTQTGGFIGNPPFNISTQGALTTSVRLTDCAGNLIDQPFVVQFSPLNVNLQYNQYEPATGYVGQPYSYALVATGGTPPYSFSVAAGSSLPLGIVLGGNSLQGTPSQAGLFFPNIVVTDSASNSLTIYGTQFLVLPLFVTRILPNATAGQPYSQQMIVSGGTPPYTFTLVNGTLPQGLTLSSSGLVAGTTTDTSEFPSVHIQISDAGSPAASEQIDFSLPVITNPAAPLATAGSQVQDSTVGVDDERELIFSGGIPPYTFQISSGALPPGVTINPEAAAGQPTNSVPLEAVLSGAALAPGDYTFTVHTTDSTGTSADFPYSWHVTPLGFVNEYLTYGPFIATLGVPYSEPMIPYGGVPPYTFTPSVPYAAGITVDANGFATGTPEEAGAQLNVSPILQDSAGNSFTNPQFNFSVVLQGGGQPLDITAGMLPSGTELQLYNQPLIVSGPSVLPPFTVSVVSGTVPPGLQLIGSSGTAGSPSNAAALLAGIAVQAGTFSFIYKVTDSAGNIGQRQVSVTITPAPPQVIGSPQIVGVIGVPLSLTLVTQGGTPPYTYSLLSDALPTGLSFDPATGTISGNPSSAASVTVPIQVSDADGLSSTINVPITITGGIIAPQTLPLAVELQTYSFQFTAGAAEIWTAQGLPQGLTLNSNTGVLSGIPMNVGMGGVIPIQVTATPFLPVPPAVQTFYLPIVGLSSRQTLIPRSVSYGASINSVQSVNPASIDLSLGVTGGTPPYTVSVSPGSQLPPGLSIYAPGAIDLSSSYELAGVPAALGTFNFSLRYSDSAGLVLDAPTSLTVDATQILQPPPATLGTPYSAQLAVTGVAPGYTVSLLTGTFQASLPAGLSMNSMGLVTGTPRSSGQFFVHVLVCLASTCDEVPVTFTVNVPGESNPPVPYNIFSTPATLGHYYVNAANIPVFGGMGPYSFSLQLAVSPNGQVSGNLPQGLQLNSTSGAPVGTPQQSGAYNYLVLVTDSAGSFGEVSNSVNVSPLVVGPQSLWTTRQFSPPAGVAGQPYSYPITVQNGTPPFSFTLLPDSILIPGMDVSSTGLISGTPTGPGSIYLDLRITDSTGITQGLETGITVSASGQPRTLQSVAPGVQLPSATAGSTYSFPLANLLAPGTGTAPFQFTLAADGSALPPGIQIIPASGSQPAMLSGSPTAIGLSNLFNLVATDSAGAQAAVYSVSVRTSALSVAPATGALPPAFTGVPYQQSISVSGGVGPYSVAYAPNSDVPPGLILAAGGTISGTPTSGGVFALWLNIVDSANNTFLQRYDLNIQPIQNASVTAISGAGQTTLISQGFSAPLTTTVQIDGIAAGNVPVTFTAPLNGAGSLFGNSNSITVMSDSNGLATTPAMTANAVPGSYTVTATASLNGSTYSAQFQLTNVTTGTANPTALSFTSAAGQIPAPQRFQFASTGGSVPFTISTSTGGGGQWLSATAAAGQTPDFITVSVDTSRLTPGSYSGVVSIQSPLIQGGTYPVPVNLLIHAALSSSPASVEFTYTIEAPPPAPVQVAVNSPAPVTFTATASTNGNLGWLTVSVLKNTTPGTILASVNSAILPPGTYSGQIAVASSDGTPLLNIPVSLTSTVAGFSVSPASISFTANVGLPPPVPQYINVSGGDATVPFTVTTSGETWLTVTPMQATTPATLKLQVNASALKPNDPSAPYTATVSVTYNVAGIAPVVQTIPVNLQLPAPGTLAVSGNGPITISIPVGSPPVSTSLSIDSSNGVAIPFTATLDGNSQTAHIKDVVKSADGSITLSPSAGATPAIVTITADATALSAGQSYAHTLTFSSLGASVTRQVNIQAVASSPTLKIDPPVVQVSVLQNAAATVNLTVEESGVPSVPYQVTIENPQITPWFTIPQPQGMLLNNAAQLIALSLDAASLTPGYYTAAATVTAGSAGSRQILIDLTVLPTGAVMELEYRGTTFDARQGQGVSTSQPVRVLDPGTSPFTFSATVDAAGAQWLQVASTGNQSAPGQPATLTLGVNPAFATTAAPGLYYAELKVVSTNAANGTQTFTAVLNVADAVKVTASPSPSPTGLLFVTSAASPPPPQSVDVNVSSASAVTFEAAAQLYTAPEGVEAGSLNWLFATPHNGTTSTSQTGTVNVNVDPTGLAPGAYTGGITVSTGGVARVVNVTLIVTSATNNQTSAERRIQDGSSSSGCTRTTLYPTFAEGLTSAFEGQVAGPIAVEVYITDNCGVLVPNPNNPADTPADVLIRFSAGDPSGKKMTLTDPANAGYTVTWTPDVASDQTTVGVMAAIGQITGAQTTVISGSATVNGTTDPSSAPVLGENGVVNAFFSRGGDPLAPGTIVAIYGVNLAAAGTQYTATTTPLPTSYQGTQVLINGIAAPLFYVSPVQINAMVPFEVQPGMQQDVQVIVSGQPTVANPIFIDPDTPGIFAPTDSSTNMAYLFAVNYVTGAIVDETHPAHAGDGLSIYALGLGDTNPLPADGVPATATPLLNVVDQPQVLIDGNPLTPQFAGLVPDLVALYQLNIQLPADLAPGMHTFEIVQNGRASNSSEFTVAASAAETK